MQIGVACPTRHVGPPPYLISSYVVLPGSIIIISLVRLLSELGNRWPRNSRGKLLSRGRVGIATGLSEKDFVQQQVNGIYTRTRAARTQAVLTPPWELIGKYPPVTACRASHADTFFICRVGIAIRDRKLAHRCIPDISREMRAAGSTRTETASERKLAPDITDELLTIGAPRS